MTAKHANQSRRGFAALIPKRRSRALRIADLPDRRYCYYCTEEICPECGQCENAVCRHYDGSYIQAE